MPTVPDSCSSKRSSVLVVVACVLVQLLSWNSAAVMVLLGTMGATMGEVVGLALLASVLDSLFALLVFAIYAGLSGGRRSRRLR